MRSTVMTEHDVPATGYTVPAPPAPPRPRRPRTVTAAAVLAFASAAAYATDQAFRALGLTGVRSASPPMKLIALLLVAVVVFMAVRHGTRLLRGHDVARRRLRVFAVVLILLGMSAMFTAAASSTMLPIGAPPVVPAPVLLTLGFLRILLPAALLFLVLHRATLRYCEAARDRA
ncbi:hypothetical protein AB0M43_19190 [Longispora sp. NPDC051575]|uniref:hypothetical protein n=1 Tax=Longispora sp. NPDC051575 TaxID=3154943 RepID=UPI0034180055